MTESDHASESEIPDWVQNHVNHERRPIRRPGPFNYDYFEGLNGSIAALVRLSLQKLRFLPVYTLDRSSEWINRIGAREDEPSYFLFDCLHGATLRMLYYHLTVGSPQEQILIFLKEHIASCLLFFGKQVEALALLDEKIPYAFFTLPGRPHLPRYFIGQARKTQRFLPDPFFPDAFRVIDYFKSFHEIFHFFAPQSDNPITPSFLEGAGTRFDELLDFTYPKGLSDEEIKEWRNAYIIDEEGYADSERKIGQFFSEEDAKRFFNYRMELHKQRDTLVEEIACDRYALRATFTWRMHEELHAQERGEQTGWTIDGIFATIFLISHLIRLVEYFTELARDIAEGRTLFENETAERALLIRNLASYFYAQELIEELSGERSHVLKGINMWDQRTGFVFNDIQARFFGTKQFLDFYIQTPFNRALNVCARAMRAKLGDPLIQELYTNWAQGLPLQEKVHYTLPAIERFTERDYFLRARYPLHTM